MSEVINNREVRIKNLKEIIKHLHTGGDPEQVRQQLKDIVGETDAGEIAAMEQELINEGMPIEEVQSMCDLHSAVVRDILPASGPMQIQMIEPGHPVDTFKLENKALKEAIQRGREALSSLQKLAPQDDPDAALFELRLVLNDLMDVDKHYNRKENLLFSCLERHGISGPSKVMWGKDDEARANLKALTAVLSQKYDQAGTCFNAVAPAAETAFASIEEMIFKEEKILFGMALETLTEEEWAEIWQQSPEYGWCLVEPREGYKPAGVVVPQDVVHLPAGKSMVFPTGALSFEQLLGIFKTLPVDLTFVDADDRVRFFSEGPDRVFSRSKAIIGRKVHNCHPPKSVHIVDQILNDFKSGAQSMAEFWIDFQGQRFVNIRYFAVRDDAGEYLGCLEVTQDCTRIRSLEGERRLLQYDT